MAKSSVISKEIKEQVQQIVTDYNAANKVRYVVSFKGGFCYLSCQYSAKNDPKTGLKKQKP